MSSAKATAGNESATNTTAINLLNPAISPAPYGQTAP
jgi:hypothetical protein